MKLVMTWIVLPVGTQARFPIKNPARSFSYSRKHTIQPFFKYFTIVTVSSFAMQTNRIECNQLKNRKKGPLESFVAQ